MRRFFVEQIAEDVAFHTANYTADHNPELAADRDVILEVVYDLVMASIVAYVDLVEQETPQIEFSVN